MSYCNISLGTGNFFSMYSVLIMQYGDLFIFQSLVLLLTDIAMNMTKLQQYYSILTFLSTSETALFLFVT